MQAGDIIFVRGHTPMSRLIRFFDKGEFSHVCIAVSKTHLIEAQYGTRSRIVPFRFDLNDCEIITPKLSSEQRWMIKEKCLKYVGKKYDYLQAFSMALKKGYDNTNNMICTEIIHELLNDIGFNCCVKDMMPNELYRHFKGGGRYGV